MQRDLTELTEDFEAKTLQKRRWTLITGCCRDLVPGWIMGAGLLPESDLHLVIRVALQGSCSSLAIPCTPAPQLAVLGPARVSEPPRPPPPPPRPAPPPMRLYSREGIPGAAATGRDSSLPPTSGPGADRSREVSDSDPFLFPPVAHRTPTARPAARASLSELPGSAGHHLLSAGPDAARGFAAAGRP